MNVQNTVQEALQITLQFLPLYPLGDVEVDLAQGIFVDSLEPPGLHDLEAHDETELGFAVVAVERLQPFGKFVIEPDDLVEVGHFHHLLDRFTVVLFGCDLRFQDAHVLFETFVAHGGAQIGPGGRAAVSLPLCGEPPARIFPGQPEQVGGFELALQQVANLFEGGGRGKYSEESPGELPRLVVALQDVLEGNVGEFGQFPDEVTEYALMAAGCIRDRLVDVRNGYSVRHGTGEFLGHLLREFDPQGQDVVRGGAPDLGARRLLQGFQEDMGKKIDYAPVHRVIAVEPHIGNRVSPGFLDDESPVAIAVVVFQQEFPRLLFLTGVSFHGFFEDLEEVRDFNLDFGNIHILGESVRLDVVVVLEIIHSESPFIPTVHGSFPVP